MPHKICILPGDGIGVEVIAAARQVLEVLPIEFEFTPADIGYGAYQKYGTPLPDATLEAMRAADATLLGAVTTPPNIPNYFSPIVRMRQALQLYANVRPCVSMPHPSSQPNLNITILRENTEGLYAGIERIKDDGNTAITERIITRKGSERIIRKAFEIAKAENRKKVTVVHKANILRQTCGLFRQVALSIAPHYSEIEMQEMLVDNCAMQLIRAPEQFEVIVTTNLFGDILSDEASMLVGGLGVAYSGNLGEQAAVFEPVHGSAPDIVGQNKANPVATFLSVAMMLDHLGEHESAENLRNAITACMKSGEVPADLGGSETTTSMTEKVTRRLQKS